jgi:hypothetical protein
MYIVPRVDIQIIDYVKLKIIKNGKRKRNFRKNQRNGKTKS